MVGGADPRTAASMTAVQAARKELARRELERRIARRHPAYLLDRIAGMVDQKTGERFQFDLLTPEERAEVGWPDEGKDGRWLWQREELDGFIANRKTIVLKARQIGITWLAGGFGLWIAL